MGFLAQRSDFHSALKEHQASSQNVLELFYDCLVVKDQIEERSALSDVATILPVCPVDVKVARHVVQVHCYGILLQVVYAFDTYLGVPALLLVTFLWSTACLLHLL